MHLGWLAKRAIRKCRAPLHSGPEHVAAACLCCAAPRRGGERCVNRVGGGRAVQTTAVRVCAGHGPRRRDPRGHAKPRPQHGRRARPRPRPAHAPGAQAALGRFRPILPHGGAGQSWGSVERFRGGLRAVVVPSDTARRPRLYLLWWWGGGEGGPRAVLTCIEARRASTALQALHAA